MLVQKILTTCSINVFLLELIIRKSPSAIFLTFTQFIFITIYSIVKCGFKKNKIPLIEYVKLVLLFFFTTIANNKVFDYGISMPLYIIFKSSSLVANLFLRIILLRQYPTIRKCTAVMFITVGLILYTYNYDGDGAVSDIKGVILMIISITISSYMGIHQEQIYKQYGKHTQEALFYCHLLPLPGFILYWREIYQQVLTIDYNMWLIILVNAITQYICVNSVFTLSGIYSSLTVIFILTLRKIISLTISILYFNNNFTFNNKIGAILTLVGSLMFTQ